MRKHTPSMLKREKLDATDLRLFGLWKEERDEEAFELLYDRYFLKLFKFFEKEFDNQAAIEDLIQDVFRKISKANIHSNFKAYVFRCAKHEIINQYRKRKDARIISISDDFLDIPSLVVKNGVLASIEKDWIDHAIRNSNLNDAEFFCIELSKMNYPYSEIAEILELTTGRVAKHVFNARKKLRKIL